MHLLNIGPLETDEVDLAEPWPLFERDLNDDVSVLSVFVIHLDVGEEAVVEVAFDLLGYLIARDSHLIALVESGEVDQKRVVHVLHAGDDDVVNDIFPGDT